MQSVYQHSILRFRRSGTGPKPLLLFHGFGQNHTAFQEFETVLEKEFTLYSIDLYFHGSEWGYDETPLSKSFWKEVLLHFLREQNLDKFTVVGFSLGAKLALATLEVVPERLSAVILIAPDGIKTSFWYSLATYPIAFRKLFKSMIVHPGRFLSLGKVMRRFGLIDKGLLRFAEHQMDTEEKRRRVYYSWIVFRRLAFHMTELASRIDQHGIKLTVIIGRFDKVIRPAAVQRLLIRVRTSALVEVKAGHNHLLNREVARLLLTPANDGNR